MLGGLIQKLFGPKVDYKELVDQGAIIVDVRSKAEFNSGHVRGAKNIPLGELSAKINQLKKGKTIITCCASGARSGVARGMLKSKGFETYNGGGWRSLNNKLR